MNSPIFDIKDSGAYWLNCFNMVHDSVHERIISQPSVARSIYGEVYSFFTKNDAEVVRRTVVASFIREYDFLIKR